MSERDGFEPGVPCWVDILSADPAATRSFYGDLFGWEFEGPGSMPGETTGEYFVARLRGRDVAGVGTWPAEGGPPVPMWNTYVQVESADRATAAATSAGGAVLIEAFSVPPAGRMAVVADPQGASFCVWEPEERKGAQLVNEPGAWSMSGLNARDPERAKRFYADAFGWGADSFETGDGEVALFRLPGFVGGEPEQPVPRDVVATMVPMSPDRFPQDAPSHWSVDFWVDAVDAAAERTAALDGKVLVPPYEVPGTPLRQAVVADPHGATFSVTEVSVTP
jgi:predicted enzyme related to lactoylglutathione lyase